MPVTAIVCPPTVQRPVVGKMPDYELRMGDIPELQLAVTERRPAWGARAWIGLLLCHRDTPGGVRKERGRKRVFLSF